MNNDELEPLQHLVRQLLHDLPTKRDWLDPALECELRERSMRTLPPVHRYRIKIDDGDTFEGSLAQFSDCFFTLSDDDTAQNIADVTDWCKKNKFKLEINGALVLYWEVEVGDWVQTITGIGFVEKVDLTRANETYFEISTNDAFIGWYTRKEITEIRKRS